MNALYFSFGLPIWSELPLPDLAPAPAGLEAELVIRRGRLPPADESTRVPIERRGDDVYLTIRGVGRFLIRAGREVFVDPSPEAAEIDVRLYLLGSAMGVVCHQRGLLPLHASAVVTGGRAVAFCGVSGIGKSTLAAHFHARGYDVLCDDVCALTVGADGGLQAWPGPPRAKLWRDAVGRMGRDADALERALSAQDKYHVPLPGRAPDRPAPLDRIYWICDAPGPEPVRIERLSGLDAVRAVASNVFRSRFLQELGLAQSNFARTASVAARAAVFSAARRRGFEHFDEASLRLEQHFNPSRGAAERATARAIAPS